MNALGHLFVLQDSTGLTSSKFFLLFARVLALDHLQDQGEAKKWRNGNSWGPVASILVQGLPVRCRRSMGWAS